MTFYQPDYKYFEAKKIVEELGDSEKDEAIKYYIQVHQASHDEDKKTLERFFGFFNTLNSFLPKTGGVLS